jgi:hypothetical protein
MARYFSLMGKRVEVQYRAGDVRLEATGTLTADSGRSIFLEEQFVQNGKVKMFRWEIPYPCILRVNESAARPGDGTVPRSSAREDETARSKLMAFRRRTETI